VKLDPTIGTEIKKTRPAVIVSNDSMNRYGARVVVVPITSNIESLFPGEAILEIKGKACRAICDQMRSIDKARLGGKLGVLSARELDELDRALRITLALS
jgi:mRNA interferase MazF